MPRAKTHNRLGVLAGASLATHCARGLPSGRIFEEAFGGAIGGLVGSRLPDGIEPATSPNHRGSAHSVAAASCLLHAIGSPLANVQQAIRENAARYRAQHGDIIATRLWETLCHVVAGILPGLLGGYLSHLAADLTTTRGLPLLTRDF